MSAVSLRDRSFRVEEVSILRSMIAPALLIGGAFLVGIIVGAVAGCSKQ